MSMGKVRVRVASALGKCERGGNVQLLKSVWFGATLRGDDDLSW